MKPALSGTDGTARAAALIRLQQQCGNACVQRLVQSGQRGSVGAVVQRQEGEENPPTPRLQLPSPSLRTPGGGAARPSPQYQLHLDPQIQAMAATYVQQQLDPGSVRGALAGVRLGPLPPLAAPTPGVAPPAPGAEPEPLVPRGAGLETPRAGERGDVMEAVMAVPAVDQLLTTLRLRATERLTRDWRRLSTGERALTVSALTVIGAGALGGVLSNPGTRQTALGLLNGRVLPVPGLDWLHVEINTEKDNLMLGAHVDVGALLPASWGFGPSSPTPIGAPPGPESSGH